MAEHHAELCALLLRESYGELAAQVYSKLAHVGRSTLPTLISHSGLPSRHVRIILAVLIQQHLVFHYTPEADAITFYEVNSENAYNLLRSGKIAKVVADRHGEDAAQVISNLMQLGHARIDDLEGAYKLNSHTNGVSNAATDHVNGEDAASGHNAKKITSVAQLHSVLYKLLKAGLISKVRKRDFNSVADTHNDAETTVKREEFPDGKVTGPKAKLAFDSSVFSLKRKWREETDAWDPRSASRGIINRSDGRPIKRARVNGYGNGVGRYEEDEGIMLEGDMIIAVNYEKCLVALRSQQLERLAARLIGDTTAKVYASLLILVERKVHRCYDDLAVYADEDHEAESQPDSTTLEISDILDPRLDLVTSIGSEDGPDMTNGYHSGDDEMGDTPVKKENVEANSYRDRNKRLKLIEQHMNLLAEHPRRFVTKIGSLGQGQWRVNFPALIKGMQRTEIETVVNSRFGTIATRIVRMLAMKGKLEEKQLANLALMRQKDIRSILTNMQEVGLVDAQEVPKDNRRQPSGSYYLWYFDHDRCRQLIISDLYKAMARLIQRAQHEKDQYSALIEKAERLDVVGHEEEYLTANDKNGLREWREKEEKLLTQLERQDDVVALLRDFSAQ